MKRQRRKTSVKPPRRSLKLLWHAWYEAKAPLFRFCVKFCALLIFFYGLSFLPICQRILAASLTENARVASAILNQFGENTKVTNSTIWSGKYAITVLPACSGVEFLVFFCAMVIAFPSRIRGKVFGIVVGVLLLLALNQIRITSLFYVGAHFPKAFDITHEDLWSMGLIVAEIILCVVWIAWARENDNPGRDAAT